MVLGRLCEDNVKAEATVGADVKTDLTNNRTAVSTGSRLQSSPHVSLSLLNRSRDVTSKIALSVKEKLKFSDH